MTLLSHIRAALPWHIVRKSQATFARDGLWTVHNADFLRDADFQRAYAAGRATGSWGAADIEWRVHVALWAARQATHVPGDFIECGVNRGGQSRAIVDLLDLGAQGRRFYLLDTFEGFDAAHPPANAKEWGYSSSYAAVQETFRPFPFVTIIKGSVPGTLAQVQSQTIAYAHIDMNCVEPERAALQWVWDRLPVGGVILLDDYGWKGHEAQKSAHDAFAASVGHSILTLPTGQGLLVRHAP